MKSGMPLLLLLFLKKMQFQICQPVLYMFICNQLCMSRNVLELLYITYDVNGVVWWRTMKRIFMVRRISIIYVLKKLSKISYTSVLQYIIQRIRRNLNKVIFFLKIGIRFIGETNSLLYTNTITENYRKSRR